MADEAECRTGGEPSGDIQGAFAHFRAALTEVRAATDELWAAIHPQSEPADLEVVLSARKELMRTATALSALLADQVLTWLRENEAGHRSVIVGEEQYFGQRAKRVTCRDVSSAARAVAEETELGEAVKALAYGDEEMIGAVWRAFEGFVRSAMSSNGLKQGACKKILGPDAFGAHWETAWEDSVGHQPAEKVLGVTNLRFVHRMDGGKPADLRALDRRVSDGAKGGAA